MVVWILSHFKVEGKCKQETAEGTDWFIEMMKEGMLADWLHGEWACPQLHLGCRFISSVIVLH